MIKGLIAAVVVVLWLPFAALAQSPVWVQIEALPSLQTGQERARDYASRLDNVAGFFSGGRWYTIALGPYAPNDAEAVLRQLRAAGQIPGDSFIADGRGFRQQFWPVGVGAPTTAQPLPDASAPGTEPVADDAQPEDPVAEEPVVTLEIPDETVREARNSEALLNRDERRLLQTALQWAGFYTAAIDGAFGRGTRNSMADWQIANTFEPTGVLTTKQRQKLIADYNSVLDGMDLQLVQDDTTGIAMQIPLGVVGFTEYEPPFARYDSKGEMDARVLLISQAGDQDRLFGLYEIMQTLSIVPSDGPRERRNAGFTLEGIDATRHSYTEVSLEDGEIKGFTLVWPAGDEERRTRILDIMQASFQRIPGVLDPALVQPDETQSIDLISGLQVRKPQFSRSGFFIDARGDVLTTSDAVGDCDRMTIDSVYDADVVHLDVERGLAVLRPVTALSPPNVAAFQSAVPRLQSDVAVAGYPYGGILTAPTLSFGTLADIRGLQGEEDIKRLNLNAQEGDAGGPVLDRSGAVLGMLLPRGGQGAQQLPSDVQFSIDAPEIVATLTQDAGLTLQTTQGGSTLPAQALSNRARDITVLVSCW